MNQRGLERLIVRLGAAVLILLLLVNAASFWYATALAVRTPYQLDYGEGIVLYQAAKIDDPRIAYKTNDSFPYVAFHYPPVYHVAARAAAAVLRIDLVAAGRTVSAASGFVVQIVIAALMFLALPRRLSWLSRVAAAAAAGLSVTLLEAMKWTGYARVDMLGIVLSVAGLAIFILAGSRSRWSYVSFVLFVAAIFTKQTFVAAPAACLLAALFVDWRQAMRLGVAFAAMGAIALGILTWKTNGGLITHLFMYNQNSFSVVRMIYEPAINLKPIVPIVALALAYAIPVSAGVVALIIQKRWRRLAAFTDASRVRRMGVVLTLMWILAFAVSLSSGKNGSNYNYFLEWNIVSCPLAVLMVFRSPWSWSSNPRTALVAILPLLVLCGAMPDALLRLRLNESEAARQEQRTRVENYATLVNLIQQAPGPVFSEDMVLLVKAGKDVPAEPAIMRELSLSGTWDERPFLQMIEQRRFPIIIVEDLWNWKRYTPEVSAAIARSYTRTREYGTYQLYEPVAN